MKINWWLKALRQLVGCTLLKVIYCGLIAGHPEWLTASTLRPYKLDNTYDLSFTWCQTTQDPSKSLSPHPLPLKKFKGVEDFIKHINGTLSRRTSRLTSADKVFWREFLGLWRQRELAFDEAGLSASLWETLGNCAQERGSLNLHTAAVTKHVNSGMWQASLIYFFDEILPYPHRYSSLSYLTELLQGLTPRCYRRPSKSFFSDQLPRRSRIKA